MHLHSFFCPYLCEAIVVRTYQVVWGCFLALFGASSWAHDFRTHALKERSSCVCFPWLKTYAHVSRGSSEHCSIVTESETGNETERGAKNETQIDTSSVGRWYA